MYPAIAGTRQNAILAKTKANTQPATACTRGRSSQPKKERQAMTKNRNFVKK